MGHIPNQSLGAKSLVRLHEDANGKEIRHLIADVSTNDVTTKNEESIAFHKKNVFVQTGILQNIGVKFDRSFGVLLLQKSV